MNKFIAMTALALILSAPAAHAEYTGGGAIAPSGGISAPKSSGHTSLSISGQNVDDAKDAVKQHWQDFKAKHGDDWEKLEAARRAHWHGAQMQTGAPAAEDGNDTGGGWNRGSEASDGAPVEGGDGEVRPSKWETFKANHADTKEAIKDGAENARGNMGKAKEEIKGTLHQFAETHHDNVDAAKENYQQWKTDHQDTIETVKEKAGEWKENHQETIDAAKGKWQDFKARHARQ